MSQLALDLFGDQARAESLVDRHQVGQIRLPWDTAGGDKAGDLIPAWRCCACGGVEPSKYLMTINHGCCDELHWMPYCQNPPRPASGPYRMDAHWIPPTSEPAGASS